LTKEESDGHPGEVCDEDSIPPILPVGTLAFRGLKD